MIACTSCDTLAVSGARFCPQCGASLGNVLAGRVLDHRYRLVRLIGSGGMGHVYRALHVHLNKEVAIKVLAPELADHAEMLARLRREAMAASQLAHPHVAATLDFGRDGDIAYMVMELVEGPTLERLVQLEGPLGIPRAIELARQTASALGAAHAIGIVHRDIKPANVLVTKQHGHDHAKVVDFGLAQMIRAPGSRLTAAGIAVGTPAYIAPEQLRGLEVDARADVYALGALIYELLTGRPPFDDEDTLTLSLKHLQEVPRPPSSRSTDREIPPALDQLVLAMLAKRPDDRPGDGMVVAGLLAELAPDRRVAPALVEDERAVVVLRFLEEHDDPPPELEAEVAAIIEEAGGTLARAAGDDIVCHFTTCDAALTLAATLRRYQGRPKIAVHHGAVQLGAGGGAFGPAVNLALRLVRHAEAGEALVTDHVRSGLANKDETVLENRGEVRLGSKTAVRVLRILTSRVTPPPYRVAERITDSAIRDTQLGQSVDKEGS